MKYIVVVDAQNDFVTGALANKDAQVAVPRIRQHLIEASANPETKIIFTKDTHKNNYMDTLEGKKLPIPHCIENTEGWEIVPELKDFVTRDNVYRKRTFGSAELYDDWSYIYFGDEEDLGLGKEFEIEFCGFCTDICVISNALAARMALPNNRITVNASLCAGVTTEKHAAALEVMKSCQIDIIGE